MNTNQTEPEENLIDDEIPEKTSSNSTLTPENGLKYANSTSNMYIKGKSDEESQPTKKNKAIPVGNVTLNIHCSTRQKLIDIKNDPSLDIKDRSWNGFILWLLDYIEQLEGQLEGNNNG